MIGAGRFLLAASGDFLGMAKDKSFIPIDAITDITAEEVRLDQTREPPRRVVYLRDREIYFTIRRSVHPGRRRTSVDPHRGG